MSPVTEILHGETMARYLSNLSKIAVGRERVSLSTMVKYPRVVLGIETSCDDTGAAVVDENGTILGEALHCQKDIHLKSGGIIPTVAQQLHRDNINKVVDQAIHASGISPDELSAIATTVKPGLGLCLGVGLSYSLELVNKYHKPFIPIHHMEAHALTVRLLHPVEFPFLVLLISGGHCILAVVSGVSEFMMLGQSLDEAPGDTLDKVARRLSLINHPECSAMSGGEAIEHLALQGDRMICKLKIPMSHHRDCNFSFAGLRNQVNKVIEQKEAEEGICKGQLLTCVADIAAAVQHTVAHHLAQRTQRAIYFCKKEGLLPTERACLVASGGVASNRSIRRVLQTVTDKSDMTLLCPPPMLCTDNGVMIAWNGIEKLRTGVDILHNVDGASYEPRASLGTDISKLVRKAAIKVPPIKI